MSIMMSASSSTNKEIFVRSRMRCLKHQSSVVPGVPMMICSSSAVPFRTAGGQKAFGCLQAWSSLVLCGFPWLAQTLATQ